MLAGLAELTDEQLMSSCKGADPEKARALVGELAARYFERVTGFVFGYTRDRASAQDLTQEAFVRVFRHRERYQEVARFSTWLYTIARNLALNEVRNRKHRPRLAEDGRREGEGGDAFARNAAPAESPLEAVERGDLQALVRREVEALSPNHREVVVLCDLEERSYAEAAEILGVPVGTIRSRLSRARDQLAQRLERHLGGGSQPAQDRT
jgi:RNA polymerase sigma-70 factor (ECF subfamily)